MIAQPSLFADLEAPEGETLVGYIFSCSAGHAKRGNFPAGRAPVVRCSCGRQMIGREITGKRTGHRCDARCMFATGPDCQCSCGGLNHGIGFGSI